MIKALERNATPGAQIDCRTSSSCELTRPPARTFSATRPGQNFRAGRQPLLGQVRRRVQNDTLGHRGRKDDPLYRIRKIMLTGNERVTDTGRERLLRGPRTGDPNDEVLGAWLAKNR